MASASAAEDWLNSSASEDTGHAPTELLDGNPRPGVFSKLLKKAVDQLPVEDSLAEKLLKAYARIKLKTEKRNRKRRKGRTKWKPNLSKASTAADEAQGVAATFQRPFEGPY
jgi:hypothetical protein